LVRTREIRSQVGFFPLEHKKNISGAFRAGPTLAAGKDMLLVDDIVTTGATLAPCSDALVKAGERNIYALTRRGITAPRISNCLIKSKPHKERTMTVNVEIYARNMEVDEPIKDYVTKKASKLDRYLNDIEQVRVDLEYFKSARSAHRSFCGPDHRAGAAGPVAHRRAFRCA